MGCRLVHRGILIHICEGVRASVGGIACRIYQYDLESNINQIFSEQGTYNFGYDNLYRLTIATYPDSNAANDESFGYDGVGNRTTHTQTDNEDEASEAALGYNNHSQLMQSAAADSTATFTYNANGHTATKVQNGTTTEYVYNHEERLIAVKINNVTVGEYAYNANGMRVKKTVNGTTAYYLYNENGLAAEYDGSGNLIKEYHFHPQQTWMTEPLFQRTASNQIYYYQNDHLGTPQRMIQSNGAVVWQASYTAFGEAEIVVSTVENNLRFPGQYFDQETGLYHNYHRDYEPTLGRYIQADPIGLAGGMNRYGYAYQNPLIFFDPNGEHPIVWAAAVGVRLYCSRNPVACAVAARAVAQAAAQAAQAVWDVVQEMCRDNEDEDEGCQDEIKDCTKKCAKAQFDPDLRNVWGGSWAQCMLGCVSWRCMDQLPDR